MAYNGSGLFVIDSTGQPVAASTLIQASVFNALTADLGTGLSTAITKDGQTTITANLPMAGYRHTGVGNASARTMYAAAGQVQDNALCYGSVGGTADVITLTLTPSITAYAAGQKFAFIASGANTGAVTINVNSVGAKDVTKQGTTALSAGNIASGMVCVVIYDGTRFQLINPVPSSGVSVSDNNTWTGTQTFRDNKFEITDDSDTTKKLALQLSGITTATTRTLTVPDKSGTLAVGQDAQEQTYQRFTTGGSSTAYTLTPTPATTANAAGQRFRAVFHTAAGTTPTLAVSGQTALNLKYKDSTGAKQAVSSTQIPSSWVADVECDGTDWVVLNVPPVSSSSYTGTQGIGVIKGGAVNVVQNVTRYLSCPGDVGATSGLNFCIPKDGTLSELRVKLSAAVAAGQSIIITVQKNGIDTALTCTITETQTTGEDTTHSVRVGRGDRIRFKYTTSATFGSTTDVGLSIKAMCDDTNGMSFIPQRSGATTTFEPCEGGTAAAASLSAILTDLALPACKLVNHCGGGSSEGMTMRQNDVTWPYRFYVYESSFFAENDLYSIVGASAAPTSTEAVSFESATVGAYDKCVQAFTSYAQVQNTTRYCTGHATDGASATESDVQFPMPACTIKNLRVCSNTVMAAGQTSTVTIRKNGADTGVTATLTDASRIATDLTHSVAFAAGDLLTVKVVSGATAGTHTYNIIVETEATP